MGGVKVSSGVRTLLIWAAIAGIGCYFLSPTITRFIPSFPDPIPFWVHGILVDLVDAGIGVIAYKVARSI